MFVEAQSRIVKQVWKLWCIDTAMETRGGCKAPAAAWWPIAAQLAVPFAGINHFLVCCAVLGTAEAGMMGNKVS